MVLGTEGCCGTYSLKANNFSSGAGAADLKLLATMYPRLVPRLTTSEHEKFVAHGFKSAVQFHWSNKSGSLDVGTLMQGCKLSLHHVAGRRESRTVAAGNWLSIADPRVAFGGLCGVP